MLLALTLGLCSTAPGKQIVAHFNGALGEGDRVASVDVNDFATSPDRLATSDSNAPLGPPGSGFPGDGPQGRALAAGVAGAPPQFMHIPLDKSADFSQGTFEAWVKTAWDWTEPERHSFIDLRLEGEKRNGVSLGYDGRMGASPGLAFKINDGDGTGDYCISCSGRTLGWKKGEWHHLAASWTPTSCWLFADGTLVASATYAEARAFSPPGTPLRLGEPDWLFATPCAALIDEVRVCDEALYAGCENIPWSPAGLAEGPRPPEGRVDIAEVTASSSAAAVERAEDVPRLHDGLYGKGALLGWTQTTGEVTVTLPEPKAIAALRWSRDGRPLRDRGTDSEAGWAWITDMPSDFVIEVAGAAGDWSEVVRKTGFYIGPPQLAEEGVRILHTFAPVTATRVRMKVSKVFAYGAGAGPVLDEVEVLEAGTGVNLARQASVSTGRSVRRYDYSPAHLIDHRVGEAGAWKASAPGPATVTLVLRQDAAVRTLEWSRSAEGLQGDGTPSEMVVEGQVGGQWVELATVTGNRGVRRQRTALKPTVTRQVRLRILDTVDHREAALDEVALY